MKKLLCMIMVLIMMAALIAGCGEQKKLLGSWEYTLELSDLIRQKLEEVAPEADFPVGDFAVTAQLTFEKDGTFVVQLDQNELSAAVDALMAQLEDGLMEMLQSQLEEQGLTISVDELLALSGLSQEELTEQLRQSFDADGFMEQLSDKAALKGFYQVKGDKLLFCADAETKLDAVYTLYTVEENILTFHTHVGDNAFLQENLILGAAPVEFTKVP